MKKNYSTFAIALTVFSLMGCADSFEEGLIKNDTGMAALSMKLLNNC